MVKLNFDRSVSKDKVVAAFILRNCDAHVVEAGVLNLDRATVTFDEAMGLKEGLKFARSKGFQRVVVERDTKIVIEAVKGSWEVPWKVNTLIEDAWVLLAPSGRSSGTILP
ncbi:hypothetical protein ACFX1T_038279 [Malus domestica]